MQVAQSGQPFPFEYAAFDNATDLVVRASIWRFNSIGGTWDFISGIDMPHVANGLYAGEMTAEAGKQYLIQKLVYTDSSHTTLDAARSQGTEGIQCVDFSGSGGGASGLAYISTASDLIGTIDLTTELEGVVDACCD